MSEKMLTTIDNNFDPFSDFKRWYELDIQLSEMYKRPNCCQYVDRIVKKSPNMSEDEEEEAYENALNEIIKIDPLGVYKIVEKE